VDGICYISIDDIDMFERISNGLYPSALHRVMGSKTSTMQYSIPAFVAPKMDEMNEPQAARVERGGEKVVETKAFRDYSQMMLEQISVR
jgi:isopenicillin N synthase-like dioxygenase